MCVCVCVCDLLLVDGGTEFPDLHHTTTLRVRVQTSDCLRTNCLVFELITHKTSVCVCVCVKRRVNLYIIIHIG